MDGWSAYEKLVLSEISEVKAGLEDLRGEVVAIRIDVATLKVKAGIWGGMAGMVPALITALVAYMSGS